VNGQPALGAAGFALVSGQPLKSAVLAQGAIDVANRSMTAKSVEAWVQKDIVHGHVTGRDAAGNLTVKGLSVDFANGGTTLTATALLNQTITVQAASAKVYERFVPSQLDHNAVGVGARIFARGTFNQGTMTLDCSQGHVYLPETGIFGFANQAPSGGLLNMKVARFGRRPVAGFNFTVGTTVTADPDNYIVNTGTLNIGAVASGAPVVIRGLVMREIPPRKVWRLIAKETAIGVMNGVIIGGVTALAAILWHGNPFLGLVVGLAMLTNLIIAGITGAAIPLAMKAAGLDPAQCSNIILTTFTDVMGFLTLLGFAALFENKLL